MREKIQALSTHIKHGVLPAMATPLLENGYTVAVEVVPQLVDFLIAAGVKGLFVGGTTGEGILLETRERMRLHEESVATASSRVPVVVHVGANRLDVATSLARHAAQVGADAIAAVTPYYYGIDDDGLVSYYSGIAEAAPDVPLLLYDIPHMAVNTVSPALLGRLHREIPSLFGMKSSQRDAQVVRRLIDASPDGFVLLAGNESVAIGMLSLGAHGLISGLSTAVPEPFVALAKAIAEGDSAGARQKQHLINELLSLMPAGQRIGAIKRILSERGIPCGPAVPPRLTPGPGIWPQMQVLLVS